MVPLAGIGMALAGMLAARGELDGVVTPQPSEWIGQLPKTCVLCKARRPKCKLCQGSAWRTPRGALVERTLTPQERYTVNDQNDEIDAVGIGLWRCGRLRAAIPGIVV